MSAPTRILRGPLALALFLAIAAAAFGQTGKVWVVDAGGTGDFTEIQPAVDVAADGDTVLVHAAAYNPVRVVHKGVAIVAKQGHAVTIVGGVEVVDTLVEHEVILGGLRIRGSRSLGNLEPIVGTIVRGPLRVDGCVLEGADGIEYSGFDEFGTDCVRLEFALDASFRATELHGGDGAMSFSGFDANKGGECLVAEHSLVAVHDCLLVAGDGGAGDFQGCDIGGKAGHAAVLRSASTLHSLGSRYEGGDGGGDGFLGCNPGGHGIVLDGAGVHANLLDNELFGGLGACSMPDGQGLVVLNGATANSIAGNARSHTATTPATELAPMTFTFHGRQGDRAFLLLSNTPGNDFVAAYHGPFMVGLPLASERRLMGTIPGSGTLVKQLVAPALPAGIDSSVLYLQSMFQDPLGGVWLASPTALVILDTSF